MLKTFKKTFKFLWMLGRSNFEKHLFSIKTSKKASKKASNFCVCSEDPQV